MDNYLIDLDQNVISILETLRQYHYESYVVGGAVRDSLLGRSVNDWDITTNCLPDKLLEIFPHTISTGLKHGTITAIINNKPYEITTYRIDGEYLDGRKPDNVYFTTSLEEDLKRRDFTINALAYNPDIGLIDHHNGIIDLKKRIVRCIGNPQERFLEDHLRILRAFRFAYKLDFSIETSTLETALKLKNNLLKIAYERIQAEFNEILLVANLEQLRFFLDNFAIILFPELAACKDVKQNNPYHLYDVYEHTLVATSSYCGDDLIVKLALLFHDLGKPITKTTDPSGIDHFYGHNRISTKLAKNILESFHYSKQIITNVTLLIEMHSHNFALTKKHFKKLLSKLGIENTLRLIEIKYYDDIAKSSLAQDRLADKEKMLNLIDEIISSNEPISIKDLAIDGNDLIEQFHLETGIIIGEILDYLVLCVIDDPTLNNKKTLLELAKTKLEEL